MATPTNPPTAPSTPSPAGRSALLIVDPRPETREWTATQDVRMLAAKTGSRLALATGPTSAKKALEGQLKGGVGLILVHPGTEGTSELISAALQSAPEAPVYLLGATEEPGDPIPEALALPNVRGWLENPIHLPRLENLVLAYCRPKKTYNVPREFVEVRVEDSAVYGKPEFDLYVREESGNYRRIAQAGQAIEEEEKKKLVSGEVVTFFIRSEVQENYVRWCERVVKSLSTSSATESRLRVMQNMILGNETLNLAQARGITRESIDFAGKFVLNMGRAVKELDLARNDKVSQYLAQSADYQHSTSVAAMAGLLARAMKLSSEISATQIGLAGLFHDIGLHILGLEDAHHGNEATMSPEVLALYQTHPVVGAEELARLPGIDPLVVQAVEQHHIRRDGSGFPQQSKFSFIHICSEIIGICDELDFRLRRKRKEPAFDVFESMKTAYPGFSRPVVAAFLRVFGGQGEAARSEPMNPPPGLDTLPPPAMS